MSAAATSLSFADYAQLPAWNFSSLKHAATSPLHYRHHKFTPSLPTAAMRLGTLAHAIILEGILPGDVAVYDDRRAGKTWEVFSLANADKMIVKSSDIAGASAMANAVRSHPVAASLLASKRAIERVYEWMHEPTGRALKCRVDMVVHGYPQAIVEIKSTRSIEPRAYARESAQRLYHCQLGMYAHGCAMASGPFPDVYVIAVENKPPHDVAVYRVPEEVIVPAWRIVEVWIRAVDAAERNGAWPGVAPELLTLDVPEWAMGGDVDTSGIEGGDE